MHKSSWTSDKSGGRFQETADICLTYKMSDQSHANTGTDRPLPEVNSDEEEENRELSSRLPIYGELATRKSIRGLPPLWCTPCSPLHPIGGTHSRHNNDGFPLESGSTSTVRSLESGSTSTVWSLEGGSTSIVRSLESGSTSTVRSLESGSTSIVWSLESGSTSIVRSLESGSTSTAQCNPGAQSTVTTEEASPFDIPMHTASSFTSASDTVPSLVPTVPPTSLGLTIQDGVKEESFSSQDAVQASNNSMP